MYKAIVLALVVSCSSCIGNPSKAVNTLDEMGFKNIHVREPSFSLWDGCAEGDATNNPFTALNANGKFVSGVVCCGIVKGCTVRF